MRSDKQAALAAADHDPRCRMLLSRLARATDDNMIAFLIAELGLRIESIAQRRRKGPKFAL